MKTYFLFIILTASANILFAQKKLTPVSQSALTGISLPAGSKQDGRTLSTVSARMLLELESNKVNATLSTTEVLLLPAISSGGFDKDSLASKLSGKGWKIVPVKEDKNYTWLQKDKRSVIAFFSIDSTGTNLYFAEASVSPPVESKPAAAAQQQRDKVTVTATTEQSK
jgi:hypothetical protein